MLEATESETVSGVTLPTLEDNCISATLNLQNVSDIAANICTINILSEMADTFADSFLPSDSLADSDSDCSDCRITKL